MREWAISYFGAKGDGPRLGVKDLIDVEGTKTSAGSRLVLSRAKNADRDAPLLSGARIAGAQVVAKTNLNELAFGSTGINPWFGTPVNPLNPDLVPGGSSSGSAVGVASGELDVALGSDTGGSIRIPSACCGVFGLKTTFGRVSLDGVWPLSQSLDTVGPMAADSRRLELAMALLEPDFASELPQKPRIAVIDESGEPESVAAICGILSTAGYEVGLVEDPGLGPARAAGMTIMFTEAFRNHRVLLAEAHRLDPAVVERFMQAKELESGESEGAKVVRADFRSKVDALLADYDFLALPTLKVAVPRIEKARHAPLNANTMPLNLIGSPALAIPVSISPALRAHLGLSADFSPMGFRGDGLEPMPLSVQVVGKDYAEEALVGLALDLESTLNQL